MPQKPHTPGAEARFPFDRMAVERFRQAFPRARWSDERKSWFVPGKTAAGRIDRWLEKEAAMLAVHGDSKGRDAFAFDPISSAYLEVSDDLRIRTPYSKTVIEELRTVPWASWDEELRAWRVPFRSFEELRRRWPSIEKAAQQAEPEERKRRRETAKSSDAYKAAQLRNAERRRHRYPLPTEHLPPVGKPVATEEYGIVIFDEVSGELVEAEDLTASYPNAACANASYIWGRWRSATLSELIATWPARSAPKADKRSRGWWQPTLPELRVARRNARSMERRKQTRDLSKGC
ncbi:hypothetical protein EN858_00630 [Mesorhizobium sp. M4B.F.Ca.ET.215.01.1.1]|uniref:hypothetical protein n=1 Tax=unclassified Mesorhizobium TaxID=325217 RepID=UPI000FC9FB24|nr:MULTISPECIES: hypothetical protein [unclassified Mesorhizobium]RUW23191.1 hypothetical protein EOA34_19075 [Mesorhizobium sp. M4B.F.Ca.ET.013.02.1.1]RVD37480.1 hypothetical protein EN741_23260 [Mesorhizobium sp. M4B.F.Ca.ET.019.03.1.1]RWF64671.1 MAG: hypothetical protein EOS47_13975 [Mesorhizobium sp.]TGQ18353.1 hypothetical protein EN858_00630 [Mesorhizobium sp. M4B.F.Ca.ET.215.01.1.1]TGQ49390.1 hypothetical protein EN863_003260 [Mesorhizobium sp. M00.F.Ca.ET.220.01.1.1]